MYGEFLKWHISQLAAPIEVLFIASLLGFGRLDNDIIFCRGVIISEVIKEIATTNSKCPYYSYIIAGSFGVIAFIHQNLPNFPHQTLEASYTYVARTSLTSYINTTFTHKSLLTKFQQTNYRFLLHLEIF